MAQTSGVFRIGNDPALRFTPGGDKVLNLSLATNYGKKDGDGKRPTQWYDATIWGDRAEALVQYLHKGDQIYVVMNDVHIEEFDGRNGKGHKLAGRVTEVELIGGQRQGSGEQQRSGSNSDYQRARDGGSAPRKPAGNTPPGDFEDDIPF